MNDQQILEHIDEKAIVELTREMIRMQTVNPPGDELPLARILNERMSALGFQTEILPFEETRANLVCRLPGSGGRASLIMCGHLDTVPFGNEQWAFDPLSGAIADGRIHGRGAADMKGGVAAMIVAADAVRRAGISLKGDLVLALTAGEEVDSAGASRLLQHEICEGAGGLVIAEPTGLEVLTAEKGAFWLEAVITGAAAHGSSPHLGKNAIEPMADFILQLQGLLQHSLSHPILGKPTLNVGTIQGGFKTNVVPDVCRVTLDIRTVPGLNHAEIFGSVEAHLRECARKKDVRFELRVINDRAALETPADDPFVEMFVGVATEVLGRPLTPGGAAYFTDAAVLVPALKAPMVIFGPGDAACAHRVDEWVKIENLVQSSRTYAIMAARMLG